MFRVDSFDLLKKKSQPTKSYALWPYSNSTPNPIQACRLCNYYGDGLQVVIYNFNGL